MLTKKQQELDEKKWHDSQKAGYDTCGTYDYCQKCDKSMERHDCNIFRKERICNRFANLRWHCLSAGQGRAR